MFIKRAFSIEPSFARYVSTGRSIAIYRRFQTSEQSGCTLEMGGHVAIQYTDLLTRG